MDKEYEQDRLLELEADMSDAYNEWQSAEKEIKAATAWRDKKALFFAEATVRYYEYKKENK